MTKEEKLLQPFIGKHVSHIAKTPVSFNYKTKKWTHSIEIRDVILMAFANGYAMVRRPKCLPYVCDVKDLSK